MTRLGNPNYSLAGGSSVSRPTCKHDHPDAPLMFAIGYALGTGERLDSYLNGIFPPYPSNSLGGGDPGWLWYHEHTSDGNHVITVEIDNVMSPPDGMWNDYSPEKIRYEIRAALSNFAVKNPDHLTEVDAVIRKFNLGDAMALPNLMSIPTWTGTLPNFQIYNGE